MVIRSFASVLLSSEQRINESEVSILNCSITLNRWTEKKKKRRHFNVFRLGRRITFRPSKLLLHCNDEKVKLANEILYSHHIKMVRLLRCGMVW